MEINKKSSLSLWIVIGLLIFFNGYQLSGILTNDPKKNRTSQPLTNVDTSATQVQINILNGCGVSGVGNDLTQFCRERGYDVIEMGNYASFNVEQSMVLDRNGKTVTAKLLAQKIGILPKNVIVQFSSDHLVSATVIIGKDFKNLNPWKNN